MAQVVIRAATADDAVAIHRVTIEAWRAGVDPRSSGHRLTHDDVAAALGEGGAFVAVARDTDDIVGSVLWARIDDTVEVMKVAVLPTVRCGGFGRRLVTAVEEHARLTGAVRTLLAVSAFNPTLVGWYETQGYAVQHEAVYLHASPYSPPPIVLVKRLDSDPAVTGTVPSPRPLR
jgi:ribosomal protein S18 acetylase RimI-like enzyme